MSYQIEPHHLLLLQTIAKERGHPGLGDLQRLYLDAKNCHAANNEAPDPACVRVVMSRAEDQQKVALSISRTTGAFVQLTGASAPLHMAVGKFWSFEATVPLSNLAATTRWT